jgi:hypothetical protein
LALPRKAVVIARDARPAQYVPTQHVASVSMRQNEFRPTLSASVNSTVGRQESNGGLIFLFTAIIFLLILILLMVNSNRMLDDSDTYWHIVVGERILRTHSFPTVDEYSYTRAGTPWIAKEWLSQVLFSVAYSRAGWFGVTLLTATVSALASSILFAWLCRRVEPLVAVTMTAVTFSLGLVNLLARPLVFFYLLVTLCACGLVGAVEKKKAPWWLPPLVALWANLHASFPIAIILAGLFSLEAVASATPDERSRTAVKWGLALLAALAATGATPYGYESLLVSLKIFGAKEIDALEEWKPIPFDVHGAYGVAFIAGSLAILALARAGWARAAPVVVCAALMVRYVRFFPLFAIVSAPAVATSIARLFPRFARRRSAPSAATRKAAAPLLAVVSVATVLALSFMANPVPNPAWTPSAALEAARRLPVSGLVFNDYPFGGYLIFEGVKTYWDGRTELYIGDDLFKITRDAELGENDAAFLSLLDEHRVNWALLVNGYQGAEKLHRSKTWKQIYEDKYSIVFARAK